MFEVFLDYLFALVQLAGIFWGASASLYVWYRVWYVERLWQEPSQEKSEKAISVSGEIFDISKALMLFVGGVSIVYMFAHLIRLIFELV